MLHATEHLVAPIPIGHRRFAVCDITIRLRDSLLALAPQACASLRDAGFAARVVMLGCGFSCARVWLFEDFD